MLVQKFLSGELHVTAWLHVILQRPDASRSNFPNEIILIIGKLLSLSGRYFSEILSHFMLLISPPEHL